MPTDLCSLRASSPIWATEVSLARTRERGAEERRALPSSAPRGFAARSRVLARLVSLAQIGELARRLVIMKCKVHAKNEFTLQNNRRHWKSSGWFSCVRVKGKTRAGEGKTLFVFFFPPLKGRGCLRRPRGR